MDMVMRPVADAIEVPTELLVAGAWRPAGSGRRLEVSDPATGTGARLGRRRRPQRRRGGRGRRGRRGRRLGGDSSPRTVPTC